MTVMATEKDSIPFSALFSPADVICHLEDMDRDRALLEMLRLLARRHRIGNIEEAHAAVVARENDLPTVVAPGMAVPHARLEGIDEILVAVATSREGIAYDAPMSDNRIKLLILTLAPKAAPGAYLQALGCLAKVCQDPSTADIVSELPTAEQIWAFFDTGWMEYSSRL